MHNGSIHDLNRTEKRRLEELLEALRTDINRTILPGSRLMTEVFTEEFTSRLLSQHVFLGNPLVEASFDTAFIRTALEAGFDVKPAPSGQRFCDLKINGSFFSLKTTKAKGLKMETLHISKLTEAAWIQDCRTAQARQQHTLDLFNEYTDQVESILQFRYFPRKQIYELVEIPCSLLKQVLSLPKADFIRNRREEPRIDTDRHG